MKTKIQLLMLFLICSNLMSAQVLWEKTYHFGENESFEDVVLSNDNGYVLLAEQWKYPDFDNTNTLIVKLDEAGDTLWTRTFYIGNNAQSINTNRIFDVDNGSAYMVIGESYEIFNEGSYGDIYWLKISSEGDSIMCGNFPADSTANSVEGLLGAEKFANDDIVWAQQNYSLDDGERKTFLRKMNAEGEVLQSVLLDDSDSVVYKSMLISSSQDVLLVGYNSTSLCVLKSSLDGVVAWKKYYGPIGVNIAFDIVQREDGDFQIVASTDGYSPAGIYLIQIDENGNEKNSCTFQHWLGITLTCCNPQMDAIAFGDGIMVFTQTTLWSNPDFQLHKVGSDCTLLDLEKFIHPGEDYMYSINKISDNKVMLLGSSYTDIHEAFAILLSDSLMTDIHLVEDPIQDILLYPNPTSDEIYVSTNLGELKEAIISLYDLAGRKIKQWNLDDGVENQHFSLEGMNSGLYFWQIIDSTLRSKTGQLTIQK